MRVAIYLGNFQYGVVNDFAKSVGAILENYGVEVFYIDVTKALVADEFYRIFEDPIEFVLGFNGLGYELTENNMSFYDTRDITYVMWLVDHPVHLIDRVKIPIKNKVIICIDESHLDYIENNISEEIITSFIPHAVNKVPWNTEYENKLYDVTFAGHINDIAEFESEMKTIEELIPGAKKLVDDQIKIEGNVHLADLLERLYTMQPSFKLLCKSDEYLHAKVLYSLDRYIRAIKRNYIIQQLLECGVEINFFGSIPVNHTFIKHPLFKNNAIVDFEKLKKIYSQSKLVLNVLPNFPNGAHERIFTSIMYGALPVTDANVYINNHLPDVIKFTYNSIEESVKQIKSLLNDDSLLKELIMKNYSLVVNEHTWENRTNELLYVVDRARNILNQSKI